MNLHNHKFFGANEAPLPSAEVEDKCVWAYLHKVSLAPPQGEVIILYQDVILKANGAGASFSGKLKNSQSFNTMWSVNTREELRESPFCLTHHHVFTHMKCRMKYYTC